LKTLTNPAGIRLAEVTTALDAAEGAAVARLSVPAVGAHVVRRPRLLEALDDAFEVPLTLVSAPAGSGKTVLISSWFAERRAEHRLAWLSVADPRVFWAAAADSVATALGLEVGLGLPGETPLAGLLHAFANLDEPLVLVVDDFDHIRSEGVLEPLRRIVAHAPANLHLVLSGRRDPDLTLHRLRLGGALAEVRARDLAFTPDEAMQLFVAAGLDLEPELAAALVERTEGWAGALRFAALSIRDRRNAESFVLALARTEQAVSEYLVSEVLATQSEELRDFMLRTSLCERIDGDLADALTRRTDGARTLAALERDNVFIELQPDGRWYRYHRLFAELLATEARHELGPEIFAVHRVAARRLAAAGDALTALRHALASRDCTLVAELVAKFWMELVGRGELGLAEAMVETTDSTTLRSDPHLALLAAWCRLGAGDREESQTWLEVADAAAGELDDVERRSFDLGRSAVGILQARANGDLAEIERLTAQLVRPESLQASRPGVGRRAFVLYARGMLAAWRGDLEVAAATLEAGVEIARRSSLPELELDCAGLLALVYALRGELKRAARFAELAIALVEARPRPRAPLVPALAALAFCELEWNDLAAARARITQASELVKAADDRLGAIAVSTTSAWLELQTTETSDEGRLELAALGEEDAIPPLFEPAVQVLRARMALRLGDLAGARAIVEGSERAEALAMLARVELADDRIEEGLSALARAAAADGPGASAPVQTEIAVLRAVASDRAGLDVEARTSIERALELAEPEKVRRPFLEAGPTVAVLLRRAIRAGSAHRWLAGTLLAVLDGRDRSGGAAPHELLEPLSSKERVVLRYLPTLMSNQEIAGELFVSVNTIKTHLKSIYRKLDTSNRREAVRRARELRLIG
jgi:LuxR family transcriptional regulator, maltose regulon positive regulatory protein